MLPVSEELKELYKKTSIQKQIVMSVAGGEETITNHDLFDFSIKETICSEEELTLGGCEASVLKMRIDAMYDIVGKQLDVVQVVDGIHEMPFGSYKVDSAKRTDDFRYRDIIAYDISKYALDKDVANWYNNDVIFPLPLKLFRELLFAYIELPLEDQDLINDSVLIEKTIKPSTMTAREIAKAIGEITGTFGMMRRSGEFSFIKMSAKGLYPAEDLYPEEDLYPAEVEAFFSKSGYFNSHYEDYVVKGIDSLKICMEEGDVGAVVDKGSLENPYIIVGNFLVYGKNHEQLSAIGREILDNISDIIYIPQVTTIVGLPYLEPGDSVVILTKYLDVESYIFTRVLKGVQSLRDEIEATGSESRENKVSPNQEIQILKGKSFVLEETVDGLDIKITDVEANAIAKIEATATEIRGEVSTLDNSLRSLISITSKEIRTEVANEVAGLNSKIMQTSTEIRSEVSNKVAGLNSTITQTATEIRNEIRNEVAGLNSTISQTDTQIRAVISNEVEGLNSSIELTASSLTTKINDEVRGLNSTISQTATEIHSEVSSAVEGLNSTITQKTNEISTEVSNKVSGLSSKLTQTESSLTSQISDVSGNVNTLTREVGKVEDRIASAEGDVNTLTRSVNSLSSKISNVEDDYTEIRQGIREISFDVYSDGGIVSKLQLDVNGIKAKGVVTFEDLRTEGSTTINGSNITTGLLTGVAAKFVEDDGAFWWGSDIWVCDTNGLYCKDGRHVTFRVHVDSGTIECGNIESSGDIWIDDSWYENYTVTECFIDLYNKISDKRLKNSIKELTEDEMKFIFSIKPTSFIYNDKRGDKSTHYGFIAQNVKEELEKYGIEDVICKKITSGRNKGYYGIAYDELIAPIVGALQQINKRVEKLEENQWTQI